MATPFPLGAYVGFPNGNDSAANAQFLARWDAFSALMGARPRFFLAYVDQGQDPSQWIANQQWGAWSAACTGDDCVGPGSGAVPVLGVPLASNAGGWANVDTFLQQILAGAYDDVYRGCIKAWADQGYRTVYARLGYEYDGTYMPWGPSNSPAPTAALADFVAAFRHIADLVHEAASAAGIQALVTWNPNSANWAPFDVAASYPGDDVVDVVGIDSYSPLWPADLTNWGPGGGTAANLGAWVADPDNRRHGWDYPSASAFSAQGDAAVCWSVRQAIALAKAHGKPLAVCECGAGDDGSGHGVSDDTAFAPWLAATLAEAEASGVSVLQVNVWAIDDGQQTWGFLAGESPEKAAAWAAAFGVPSAAPATSRAVPLHTPYTGTTPMSTAITLIVSATLAGSTAPTFNLAMGDANNNWSLLGSGTVTADWSKGLAQAYPSPADASTATTVSIMLTNPGDGIDLHVHAVYVNDTPLPLPNGSMAALAGMDRNQIVLTLPSGGNA